MNAVAQTPTPRSSPAIPRLPGGKPNLNGIWQAINSANWDLEDHSASASPVVQMGALYAEPAGIGIIEGGTIPYKPEALATKKKNFADRVKLDPEAKCYMPGIPRVTYMPFPFEITQSQNDILFAYSWDTATRIVLMARHRPADLDTWMGTSNGHWEGDTLVIDVTGFNGRSWLDRAGDFTTDSLHVVERYTPLDANSLRYEATIEDPDIYTQPWKISFPLYRLRDPHARLLDFKCVEFVEDLMYGDLSKKTQ